jgi:formate hydrogenlyase subunit 3/multisubunit Na+/H+ antiporter MnhD subunit
MFFYLIAGIASAIAILFMLAKLNIKKVLCFDILVDIGASVALIIMFAGTFAGMMAAILGGAIISIVLFILKKTIGYEKPKREGFKVRWVNVPPR